MRDRGGQFYIFDAFFAAAILFLGIGFLVTQYTSSPQQAQTQVLVSDVSGALVDEQLGNIFNNYTINNFDILEEEYTPAQQAHAWWYDTSCGWCMPNATALVSSLIAPVAQPQNGIKITLQNETDSTVLYEQTPDQEATLMIVNHQVVVTDLPTGEMIGPDTMEVRVWY